MKRILPILILGLMLLPLTACRVTQTEEGELPNIDVDVDGGNLPKYDVDGPDVDIHGEEKTITVPDVDINSKEVGITVPDVDVTLPGEEGHEDDDPS